MKVKTNYFKTLVIEESKMTADNEFVTAPQELAYYLDPIPIDGDVIFQPMNDNPELFKKIEGKIVIGSDLANETVSLKLGDDPEAKKIPEMEIKLDGKGEATFEAVVENHLTAEGRVTGTVTHTEKGVVATGEKEIEDKTAPTADPVTMDYFQLSKKPSTIPFTALQLLENIADTNPNLSLETDANDIMAKFTNEDEIKNGLTKLNDITAKIELKDKYNNSRIIESTIVMHKNRLLIDANDSTVYLSEIAERKDGVTTLKDSEEVQKIIEEKSEIKVRYIKLDGNKTELGPDDFQVEEDNNSYVFTGEIQPTVGEYPLTLNVNYVIHDSVDGKDVSVPMANSADFNVNVIDGALSITGEGDLSAETDITTKPEDISLKDALKLSVTNTNFETDSWVLEAKADAFSDSNNVKGFPMSLIYFDAKAKTELDLNNGPVIIDESRDREKDFNFSESEKTNNYIKVRTLKASSNWASPDETYSTTINWTLSGSSDSAVDISDKLTKKGK